MKENMIGMRMIECADDDDDDDVDVYDADICSAVSTMERNLLNPDSCSSNNPLSNN